MSDLLLGALSLLLATNRPAVLSNYLSNVLAPFTGTVAVDPADPIEIEFQRILKADEYGEDEIEKILADAPTPDPARSTDLATKREAVRKRLLEVINRVRGSYESFLKAHPEHVRARLAFADNLETHGEDYEVLEQLKLALDYDPKNAATWNNYGNHFGHVGPITNGFAAYEKAIALRPFEPLYHYNYGTTVFLFRKAAMEYFHCDEQAVFGRALDEYLLCRKLAPHSFRNAFEYAQTYYGVKPVPATTPEDKRAAEVRLAEQALAAWREALSLSDNETDREGIFVHFARWQIKVGRWDEARASLTHVTRPEHAELKARVERNLAARESGETTPPERDLPESGVRQPLNAPKLKLELEPPDPK